jgi:predicted RNA binding protein YcfA (HicA-like mRNA interferase family)
MNQPIDYSKLHNLTARKLISALGKEGFVFEGKRGKHRIYRHPDGRMVAVPFHKPGQTYPPKTLKKMLESQAKWTLSDLKRLKLVAKRDP